MTNKDIFTASWGYEQTNVSFFQVIKRTASMVTVREIAAAKDESGCCQGTATPVIDKFIGAPIRRKLQNYYQDREAIKINSFMTAHTWDGEPEYFTSYY